MKTICPHCKQEFPDTPDEYLGVTLECPVCKKEFVCEKAKYCSECGAISPARAITCHQCGKPFPLVPPQQRTAPVVEQSGGREDSDSSSEYDGDDCFLEEVDLFTAWRKITEFQGRSRRKECWLYALPVTGILLIFYFLVPAIVSYIGIALLLVSVPLGVRRLHDIGLSGWCILISMIFYPLWLVLLICPSQPGENKWGPNPVGVSSDGRPHGAYVVLSFVAAIAAVVLLAVIPAWRASEESKKQTACADNMKQITTAISMYAGDNRGNLPVDLQALRPYLSDRKRYECPSSSVRYIYLGSGVVLREKSDVDLPVVMESPSNHGNYINFGHALGYVSSHRLPRKTNSCADALTQIYPKLSESEAGRIVLENARKVDEAQIR